MIRLTLDNIAYDFLTTIKQWHDDSDIDLRQLKYWIRNSRAVWIKNELHKNKAISPTFIQDLGCLTTCWKDASVCGLPSDYKVKCTEVLIPTTIETHFEPTITRVGPALLLDAKYPFVPYDRVPFVGSRRFNGEDIYSFLLNKRIYLVSKADSLEFRAIDNINVRGIFFDPEECATFTKCDGTPVYTTDTEYPITGQLVVYMKDLLMQGDIRVMLDLQPDNLNNAHDDTPTVSGRKPAKE